MSEQLSEFIEKQHARDILNAERYSRIETMLTANSERLFGGPNQKGVLTFIHEEHAKACDATALIASRVGKLEAWKLGTLKWVGGVVALLSLEGTALAFYFSHVSATVNKVLSVLPKTP